MVYEHWIDTDIMRLPTVKRISGRMFTHRSDVSENNANKVGVRVFKDGVVYPLAFSADGTTDKERSASAQTKYFQLGNVKLLNRPQVSGSALVAAGWTDAGSGTATVYSVAYDAGNEGIEWRENIIIHITPIKADGTILTPSELDDYVDTMLLSDSVTGILGRDQTNYNLILWIQENITNWTTAWNIADEYDDLLHRLQAVYYELDDDMPTDTELQQFITDTTSVVANVKRADDVTIYVTGAISGNTAYVTLPSAAYLAVGNLGVYIRIKTAAGEYTLGGIEAFVYPSVIGELITPA